jgi:hypothetical protein
MIVNTDIDIDVANRNRLLAAIRSTPAMIQRDGKKVKHNTGVYFHEVPEDPFTGMCTVDYKQAESMGYFKIDVLNVNIYDGIESRAELDELLSMDTMWELLEHAEVVQQCFHIHGHYDVVQQMKPRSLPQLAAVLAIIRPAKRHLLGKDWDAVFANVWERPENDAYFFKKAHAHAYAQVIVLQLNQMVKRSFAPS